MELRDETLWYSPSDLAEYLGCAHASALSRQAASGLRPRAFSGGAYADLIRAKGMEHERAYLAALHQVGREVVEVPLNKDFIVAAERTAELMRGGAEVIYQGVLTTGMWRGVADFLERTDEASGLGGWSYEAVDTKLARAEAAPAHVLQLCFYSEAVGLVQGRAPEWAHLELGSGRRESIRIAEVGAYYRRARAGFERAMAARAATVPYPCAHCTFCGFSRECEARWLAEDHLTRVAWIRRDQAQALEAADVASRGALAAVSAESVVDGIRPASLATLRDQARLQVVADTSASIPFDVLPLEPGRGFAKLPASSPGDVMFDLEGDPYWTAARDLTFLFGLLVAEDDGWRYLPFWGHSLDGERAAFEEMMDVIADRLQRFPGMHVYHYSPAEPSAMKRLAAGYGTREDAMDDLLRRGVLVDLLTVVRQGLRVGVESYSLKQIERLTGFTRTAKMASGADAVLGYERYLTGRDEGELEEIARYNEEDVRATLALRDWLIEVRPDGAETLAGVERPDTTPETAEANAARERLRLELTDGEEPGGVRWLAGELLEYHRREARPAWWRWFSLLDMESNDLIRDAEAIGELEPIGPAVTVGRNAERSFRFPVQDHKVSTHTKAFDQRTGKGVAVWAVDDEAGTITLRANLLTSHTPTAVITGKPIGNNDHREALVRLAIAIRDDADGHRALVDVLAAAPPRVTGRKAGASVQTEDLDEQKALARGLDDSYLLIQGPPGTGKTWTGARLIVDLIQQGHRVGVTALSHRAINNLLAEVEVAAGEGGVTFRGARKLAKDHPDGRVADGGQIVNVDLSADCFDTDVQLVAGTTWLFAPGSCDEALDYLVIDEAGQLSLAEALAAGTSSRNLILLGDPLQLPQVSQGTHPTGTNASVLEHLLGEHATVPPDRGLLLPVTRRMHPDVCQFISDEIYETRLFAHDDCRIQATGAGTGLRYLPVEHIGNGSQSVEEVERIGSQIEALVGQTLTDRHGTPRLIEASDIMVVSPYNAQVRLLRQHLPERVRVGTVDAFQGQEAYVVIFSMATSTGEDVPRSVDFLFSRNRLNVAISRARCLAYLCCAPALLETRARTAAEMKLISTLCAFVEAAPRDGP